jgi:hypothetical protein
VIEVREDHELKPFPVVLEACPDELLSSWLRRHAAYYAVSEAALIAWLGLKVSTLRTVDHRFSLEQVGRLTRVLRCDPTCLVGMTHAGVPAEARLLTRQNRALVCHSCVDQHGAASIHGVALKSWIEAWRITCRLCGGPLSEPGGSHDNPMSLRESSSFGERWWEGARVGEGLIERYVTGQTSMLQAPVALMRLLLLPSWYRPGQPFDGFYNGWLLNELIPGFDDHARRVKRRVNHGAIGSIPPALRVALLAGISLVAASPASVIDYLRPACRPIYTRHFEAFAAAAVQGLSPPIDIEIEKMGWPFVSLLMPKCTGRSIFSFQDVS